MRIINFFIDMIRDARDPDPILAYYARSAIYWTVINMVVIPLGIFYYIKDVRKQRGRRK